MGRFFADDANCGRARAWVSQDLDGELSQVERIFLAAHVRGCADCAAFAEDVRAVTTLVRSAPLEQSSLEFAFPARSRATSRRVGRVALASALVAVAGGLGVLAGSNGGGGETPAQVRVGDVALAEASVDRELRELRRVEAEEPRERVTPPGRLGGNV
jgi:predicted anti-sigma-YlaC factor YlaD